MAAGRGCRGRRHSLRVRRGRRPMPDKVAAVNSRPTRARPRLWLKSVVGALLVLVGLLAPQWAPPPLDSEQAAAQQRLPRW